MPYQYQDRSKDGYAHCASCIVSSSHFSLQPAYAAKASIENAIGVWSTLWLAKAKLNPDRSRNHVLSTIHEKQSFWRRSDLAALSCAIISRMEAAYSKPSDGKHQPSTQPCALQNAKILADVMMLGINRKKNCQTEVAIAMLTVA